MHVIGTAGHVDHGKSTLVQALTGIDPDRLAEEKRRGLTIDLGFAWLRLPSGREVGIVDVPGHERFIKNMLAGAGAINVALFVVAANEGWKPQSQEHLDILDLLGVSSAVVAITKVDAAGADQVESTIEGVNERLASTTIAGAPIVQVSAVAGTGLDELRAELERVLEATPPAEDRGRSRLWIDRVFSMRGSGTVVTGTLTGGVLRENQEVEILPVGVRARVRGIQSHRRKLNAIGPGNRTAVNLVGVEPDQVRRGDVLGAPGSWRITRRLVAEIRFLPHLPHDPSERGAFKLHVGSAELDAGLRFLGEAPRLGETGIALLALDEPAVLDWRDRFVLRDAGRRETLGGGVVLEPHPARGQKGAAALEGALARQLAGDRAAYLRVVLDEEGRLAVRDLPARVGLSVEEARRVEGVWLDGWVFATPSFEALEADAVAAVREHQQAHPLEPGMPRAALRARLELEVRVFDEVIEALVRREVIVADATVLRTADFAPAIGGPERTALMAELDAGGASPPTLPELQRRFDPALIRTLVRAGDLVQVGQELVYSASFIARLKNQVAEQVRGKGPFTVAQFRDLVGTTRKYAVPLLEYLDQVGFTRRQGDLRVLGPKASIEG